MGLNLKILKPELYTWSYVESLADQTDHLDDAFFLENVAYGYDVEMTLWRSKVYSRRHFV